jgi:hypothetical protein
MRRCLLFSLLLIAQQSLAQHIIVPLDHQVYPLLFKGETLGLADSYRMRLLPLTRTETRELLAAMYARQDVLSRADANLVEQMLGEFTDPALGEPASPTGERHLYRFEEGSTQMFLDLRGVQEVQFFRGRAGLEDETISETVGIGYFRASIGEHVFIGGSATGSMKLGAKDREQRFDPTQGPIQVAVDGSVFSDQATGYVGFVSGPFRLFAGRMHNGWGSGIGEQLGLSQLNEPMDMLKFTLDYRAVRFSYLHASLQSIGLDRYLVGHRLDFRVSSRVQVGAYETLVYARRGIQLAYLNPFVPYHFVEHQLGDLDNNMLGVDMTVLLLPGVRVFGELFIDDLNWTRSMFNHWGNKLAYHAGVHWASPLGWRQAELRVSYMRVDPWVFTHDDSLNVYVHHGESIGARIGPNADRYQVAFSLRPHRDVWGELSVRYTRQGRGNVYTPRRPQDGDRKRFLVGTIEQERAAELVVRYQVGRDMFLGCRAMYADRRDIQLVKGLDAQEKTLRLFIDINY